MVHMKYYNIDYICISVSLEFIRGIWNYIGTGKMVRSICEQQWRRQYTGILLTLSNESIGIEAD